MTDASGHVKMWHISTSTCLYTIKDKGDRQALCSSLHVVRDRVAVGSSDSAINVYDLETKKKIMSHKARYDTDNLYIYQSSLC